MFFSQKPLLPPSFSPRRVLFVRLSSPGNVVYSLPLLSAVRLQYPHAKIAWLLEENSTDLLNGHWANDHLILVKKGWLQSPNAIQRLRRRLRAFQPDLTIDVQGLFKSSFAAWISGAKYRMGFGGQDAREGSWLFNNIRVVPDEEHLVDRNFQLLQPLGIVGGSVLFDLPQCIIDDRIAKQTLHSLGLHGSFVLLCPGTPFISQNWPEHRWAEIARYLKEQWNLPSLVIYEQAKDRPLAESVVAQSPHAAILAPSLSLLHLTAISRQSTLFLGGDSNLLQIAASTGIPCLGLFGPTLASRNGPYGQGHLTLQGGTPTAKTRARHASRQFILNIRVEEVQDACDRLLSTISEKSEEQEHTLPFAASSVPSEQRNAA